MSVDFKAATTSEMDAMAAAIDTLTREDPNKIFSDSAWASIVHAWAGEVGHRKSVEQLIERDLERGDPRLYRLDPPGCGCTDCIVGWSKPISLASDRELHDARVGILQNASGARIFVRSGVDYTYE